MFCLIIINLSTYCVQTTCKKINYLPFEKQDLKAHLDRGKKLPFPDGVLINGRGPNGGSFNVEQGTSYAQEHSLLQVVSCYVKQDC